MTDLSELARGLTKAQRKRLFSFPAFLYENDWRAWKPLQKLGLVDVITGKAVPLKQRAVGKTRKVIPTPLGLALRQYLETHDGK